MIEPWVRLATFVNDYGRSRESRPGGTIAGLVLDQSRMPCNWHQ